MNLNYVGSLAQRFMQFSSSLGSTEEISENIFNAISIYIPKSLASDVFSTSAGYTATNVSYDGTTSKYQIVKITVDNYATILNTNGTFYSQWKRIFNDGGNISPILYAIVFADATDGESGSYTPSLFAKAISWQPLTDAFNDLYFISVFKTVYDSDYTGDTTSRHYADFSLCLSKLCEDDVHLSVCLTEIHATQSKITTESDGTLTDTNSILALSASKATEIANATTFVGATEVTRAEYLWGFAHLMTGSHTWIILHNSIATNNTYMIPVILCTWFSKTNASGQYVGNKLAKIRLTGDDVKPSGEQSNVDSDIYLNILPKYYENLDDKHISYFISIADDSLNNAECYTDRSVSDYPVTAYLIAKWIDYTASQSLAKYSASLETLTTPVTTNQSTYDYIQKLVQSAINTFATIGRIANTKLSFPSYSDAKKGNTFVGQAVWSATYMDDFAGVQMSGSVAF